MRVGFSNDHAAVELKKELIAYLTEKGYECINLGTDTTEAYDYPYAGKAIAEAVKEGRVDCGVAICGTGIGISLAANKVKGIRAACVSEPVSARLAKEHNHAQIICFGARIVGLETAKAIVDAYLTAEELPGRHQNRVDLVMEIEKNQ